jgi:hypothetical protein
MRVPFSCSSSAVESHVCRTRSVELGVFEVHACLQCIQTCLLGDTNGDIALYGDGGPDSDLVMLPKAGHAIEGVGLW